MNKHNPRPTSKPTPSFRPRATANSGWTAQLWPRAALVVVGLCLSLPSANAQFIRFRAGQVRVTVPLNSTDSTVVTNQVKLTGVNPSGATLSILGLPAGAGATIDVNPATSNNTPINITINTTNIPQGEYTFFLQGTGQDTNSLPLSNVWAYVLQAGHIWNGTTNAVADGPSSWTDSSKWLGGVPGAGDDVFINDLGGQTNNTYIVPSTSTNPLVSITLGGDRTIGSLRFGPITNVTRFHSIQIDPGNTLTINGSRGFRFLRDYISDGGFQNLGAPPVLSFVGGGNLVVTNPSANFALLIDNQLQFTNDMAALGNFSATVNRFALGDYTLWPNFLNYSGDNGLNGIPRRFLANVFFARTNLIKASYIDPNNYTNANDRKFGFSYLNSEIQGTTTFPMLNLGISNFFMVDAINFAGGNQQGNLRFHPGFATNNPIAIFRGTNGGRMSVFSISDAAGTNQGQGNIKANIDFASFSGNVDILADRFYIGRDRKLIVTNQTPNYQGFMLMAQGVVDVNTMILGYQEYSGQTNTTMFNGYCEGRITVTNTIGGTNLLRIRKELTLGYCTQTDPLGLGSGSNTTWGQIILSGSNTVLTASNISVGEPIHTSKNNSIEVNTNATLVVSNAIGSPVQGLDNLTYRDAILTLHLDLTRTIPYVFATNLTTAGSNTIRIASIKNLASLSGPVQLISFSAGNGSFQGLFMPPGLSGALLTTNNVGIYLTILTNTPKTLVWRGYDSSEWDLTTKNWFDPLTGLHTNFSNGDFARFDDDVSTPKTVHLAGPVDIIPGGVTMTNNSGTYVIDSASGGDIQGSANWSKWGGQRLQMDGSTTVTVLLNEGSLTGSGSIGSATVATGTTMNFAGSLNGGVNCAGVATLSGNCSGSLLIQGTGIVTNSGTYSGPFTTAEGSLLVNNATYQNGGNSTVVSNATLINNGNFHAQTLSVGGTLKDMATGGIYMNGDTMNGTRGLTINNGGTFIPGGDGIGTTIVYPETGTPNNFPGRVLFSTGSTNIFKVNPGTLAHTLLGAAYMGFGPNQNTKQFNGGTIVMSNITLIPFAAGQSYKIVQYYLGGDVFTAGTNTATSYPTIVPSTPGPGLAWDLSGLLPADGGSAGETLGGVIGVRSVATAPTNVTFNPVFATNLGTNGIGTNVVAAQLSWPSNYIGWKLQEQASSIGLSTNWTTIVESAFTNYIVFTNNITTNGTTSWFYRLVSP